MSPARPIRLARWWPIAMLALVLVAAACSTPDRAAPAEPAAAPQTVLDAGTPAVTQTPDDGASAPTPAADPRLKEAREALRRVGDAICSCQDEPCARRPFSDRLLWEGSLLLKDGTEQGRALIRAVQADPDVKAQQARIDECTRLIRAAPPAAARAAAAWLHAVSQGDAAAVAAASTPGLWAWGWYGAGCGSDAKRPADASSARDVAACVVADAALVRDLAHRVENPQSDLSAERIGSKVGRPLPGWARHTEFDTLGADHDLVSILLGGEEQVFHRFLIAVTAGGKVNAVMWNRELPGD